MNLLKRLWSEEDGQALTEYGLLVGLVAVALITILGVLATQLEGLFEKIIKAINPAYTKAT